MATVTVVLRVDGKTHDGYCSDAIEIHSLTQAEVSGAKITPIFQSDEDFWATDDSDESDDDSGEIPEMTAEDELVLVEEHVLDMRFKKGDFEVWDEGDDTKTARYVMRDVTSRWGADAKRVESIVDQYESEEQHGNGYCGCKKTITVKKIYINQTAYDLLS